MQALFSGQTGRRDPSALIVPPDAVADAGFSDQADVVRKAIARHLMGIARNGGRFDSGAYSSWDRDIIKLRKPINESTLSTARQPYDHSVLAHLRLTCYHQRQSVIQRAGYATRY